MSGRVVMCSLRRPVEGDSCRCRHELWVGGLPARDAISARAVATLAIHLLDQLAQSLPQHEAASNGAQ
jgi:hypothetical protein